MLDRVSALVAAAALTATPSDHLTVRLARAGVAAALGVRAVTGVTGTTYLLVGWVPPPRFVRLDQRLYGPGCALLAALATAGLQPDQPRLASGTEAVQ